MDKFYSNDFSRNAIFEKIDKLETQLCEEQSKKQDERDTNKEFELLYARMIAGLKLNTGSKLF